MRLSTLVITLFFSLLSSSCGPSADIAMVRQRLAPIKAWRLAYSNRLDLNENRPLHEITTQRSPQVDRNLQFVDLTAQALKEKFGISVTDDATVPCGNIRVTATEALDGRLKYFDIALLDAKDDLITKTRAWNDTQVMIQTSQETQDKRYDPHAVNESLANFVAAKIADLLSGKKMGSDN